MLCYINCVCFFVGKALPVDACKKSAEAAQIIRRASVVCFDVDSTVITEEGIDELAKYCGKGAEVARLTREAMKGSMTFQEALQLRLDIIQPSQRQIRDFVKDRPSTLSHGIKYAQMIVTLSVSTRLLTVSLSYYIGHRDFVNYLRANNTKVYLITGGFDCLIEPVATELGIPMANMYANKLYFGYNGEYAGFDHKQPTSHSGGKAEAIQLIRRQLTDNANIVMIGDGATDLEASPPADHFIGYGGNVVRPEVFNRATYYVRGFDQLM